MQRQYPTTPTAPAAMQLPTGQLTARFSRIQSGPRNPVLHPPRGFQGPVYVARGRFGTVRGGRGHVSRIHNNYRHPRGPSQPYNRPTSRGRGRTRRRGNGGPSSSLDLDRQLDGYMLEDERRMRDRLDRDLDTYMTLADDEATNIG